MSVISASVRPTVATESGPMRATKKTSTTAKTDSRTSSRTIGIASRTIARSIDPSVYDPWCEPASDSRIVAHRLDSVSAVRVSVTLDSSPHALRTIRDRVDLDSQPLAGETRDLHGRPRGTM